MQVYPPTLEIVPLAKPVDAVVSVPGSKSITNRALVLAALAPMDVDCVLSGALRSEDTEVMVAGLQMLGFDIEPDWNAPESIIRFRYQERRRIPSASADLFVANSGTTMRFLTAMVATGEGRYRLDGVARMRERPIQDLLDALNQLAGVRAISEADNGCPPVVVETTGMKGGIVHIRAGLSSQFVSALLMAAPFAEEEIAITIDGPLVSEPYIEMTIAMMRHWQLPVQRLDANTIRVFQSDGDHSPGWYAIEPDASAASYFFAAAAIAGGRILVRGMKRDMLQGDVLFVDALARMGCIVTESSEGITVEGRLLCGIDIDMNAISDTMMTLAAVACFAEGPTTIRNVAHVRHKETDRIAAMAAELRKLGAAVDEFDDGLTITPGKLHGTTVETYRDHRMAMSLALIGLKVPGVVIDDPGCVAKTYPDFWRDLEALSV